MMLEVIIFLRNNWSSMFLESGSCTCGHQMNSTIMLYVCICIIMYNNVCFMYVCFMYNNVLCMKRILQTQHGLLQWFQWPLVILLRCGEDGLLLVMKPFLIDSPGEQWHTYLQNRRLGLRVLSAYRINYLSIPKFSKVYSIKQWFCRILTGVI